MRPSSPYLRRYNHYSESVSQRQLEALDSSPAARLCENPVHASSSLSTNGVEVNKLTVRPEPGRMASTGFSHSLAAQNDPRVIFAWRQRHSAREGGQKLLMRVWIGCLYLLGVALFIADQSALAQQGSGAPLKKIRIAVPSISASQMPVYMAKDLGYYTDEGLDAEIILMRGGVSIQALVAGSVDYTGTPGATMSAAVQGVKLVVLMAFNNKSLYDLIVRPNISSYAELKGKRFGVGSLTGFSFEIPQIMLSKNGVDPKKDVAIILIGPTADRMNALRANAIQGTILEPPFNFMVLKEGFRKLGYSGDYYQNLQGALTTSQIKIKNEPEEVRRLIKATTRGFLAYKDQRKLALPIMRRYLKLDEQFAEQVYDYSRPTLTPDGTISEELMRTIIETQRQASKVSRAIDPDEIFNFSFVREAMKESTRK